MDVYVSQRVSLVQSINGFVIPDDVHTDEQLNNLFVYAGQPNRSYFFNKTGQIPEGLATIIAGSPAQLWNYGFDEWYALLFCFLFYFL